MFRPPKQSSTAEAYAVFSSISCDLIYTIPVLFDIDKYILEKVILLRFIRDRPRVLYIGDPDFERTVISKKR